MDDSNKSGEDILKELNDLKQENLVLKAKFEKQLLDNQKTEESFKKQSKLLLELNSFSIDLSYMHYQEIFPYIVTKIKDLFGIKGAWITSYDEKTSDLVVEYSSLSIDENSKIMKLLGKKLLKLRTHINNEQYNEIISEVVALVPSVHELTFGSIPEIIGKAIEKMFNIGWFVGLALLYQGKLYGTLIVLGEINQIPPKKEEIAAFAGIASNALGRKKAEESLQEKEQNYQEIFNYSNDALFILEISNGAILDVNKTLLKMFGFDSKQEALNYSFKDLSSTIEEYNHEKINSRNQKAFESGLNKFEWLAKKKNGDTFWTEVTLREVSIGGEEKLIANVHDISEYKHSEQALRESEEKYRALVENALEGIVILRFDGTIIFTNQAVKVIFDIPDSVNFRDHKVFELILPESLQKAEQDFANVEEGIDSYISDYQCFTLTGKAIWIESIGKKIIYEGLPADIVTIRDITDRKLAQEALIQSEERYRTIVEGLSIGIAIHVDFKIVFVNQCLVKMLGGNSQKQFEGYSVIDFIYPDDRQKITEIIESSYNVDVSKTDNQLIVVERLMKLDGTIITVEASALIINYYGKPALMVMINDITERRKAEEENIMLAAALRNINECITITDVNNNLIFVNDTFLNVYGFSREELIGQNIAIVKPKKDENYDINTILSGTLKGGWQGVLTNRRKDGSEFPILLSTSVIEQSDKTKLLIGTAIDITERKEAEEELIKALAKAEESDKLKTAFLQNMSHEIRTPLNGIIGFSNLLKNDNISKDDIEEFTTIIQQSGKQLIEIVNNILDISKIETGQIEIYNSAFSLNSVMTDLYSLFVVNTNIKNIDLHFHNFLDDRYSIIYSDETKINQILTNLINNAIKFTNKGSIDYGYEIKDDRILFYVKDTGIGISENQHSKIFERFIQKDVSISRNFEGAGLGLAICKGLVELLGGKIWVESEINIGTTFYFSIPYIFQNIIYKNEDKPINNIIKVNKSTILIVEDDWTSYIYLDSILKKSDISILRALNGKEALELVRNNPDINLILMDIRMPVMDGFEATTQIKKIRPDLPIIAQTAYAFSEERSQILLKGFDDYLSKPLEIDKLMQLINKYLK